MMKRRNSIAELIDCLTVNKLKEIKKYVICIKIVQKSIRERVFNFKVRNYVCSWIKHLTNFVEYLYKTI